MTKNSQRLPFRAVSTGIGVTAALALSFQGVASAHPATGHIVGEGAPGAIQGRYLVVLNGQPAQFAPSGQASAESVAHQLSAGFGGGVGYVYDHAVRGFELHADASSAQRMAADPAVDYVQQSAMAHSTGVQQDPPSWGLDRVDQKPAELDGKYRYERTGQGVTVYDLDTGINKQHSDFEDRASYGPDFINNDEESADDNGHGSHTAGTVAGKTFGVAKQAKLVAIKILDAGGSGPDSGILKALDWVVQNGEAPGVINMSLETDGPNQAMNEAVTKAAKAGFLTAAAAGNSGADACQTSPASADAALTVASIDEGDGRSGFSNMGKCVDLFAPGGNITSASQTGNGATTMSGTSMAAPHVAGAVAHYFAQHGDATVRQAHDDIVDSALTGKVDDPGAGSPNKLLYTLGIK